MPKIQLFVCVHRFFFTVRMQLHPPPSVHDAHPIHVLPFCLHPRALLGNQYTFEAYAAEFGKVYESEVVRSKREEAFSANLAKIKAHNRFESNLFTSHIHAPCPVAGLDMPLLLHAAAYGMLV